MDSERINGTTLRGLVEYIAKMVTPASPLSEPPEQDPTKLPNEETEIAWGILSLMSYPPPAGADTAAHFEAHFNETTLDAPAGSGSITKFKYSLLRRIDFDAIERKYKHLKNKE